MCKIGLFDYMRQCGTVNLHGQNTLSDKRYGELESAQSTIKNAIKDSSFKVDIYDGHSVPKDKFVYLNAPDCVFVEVTDLLNEKVYPGEFIDRTEKEPVLRQIFRFIDDVCYDREPPIERLKKTTLTRYNQYLSRLKK